MWWILLICIVVNAYVVILFKVFDRKKVSILPAIVINYFICVITGYAVFRAPSSLSEVINAPWLPFAIFLGFVFITVFNLVGLTVKEFGVMISTIFQKMSLIGPALVGIVFYAESLSGYKLAGLIFAIAAILLISHPEKEVKWQDTKLWLPFAMLLGSAILEITLYYVNIEGYADNADPVFIMTIFMNAGILGTIILWMRSNKAGIKLGKKEITGGIALGIPNFFSIYLVLYLLDGGLEGSTLFPINNVGILFLTGLTGIYFFKEKMDQLKIIGFLAALISITLIAFC